MRTWTENDLIEATRKGNCYTDVVRRLGLFPGQTALNRVKKKIAELQLDIDHFLSHTERNRGRRTWSKESLKRAIKESWSISEVVRKLGLTVTSTNWKTIQKYIQEWDLNISHFRKRIQQKIKRSLKEILKKGSIIESCQLRKKLLKADLLEKKCYKCRLGSEWQGELLTLQLDHINGDRYDNRLENLRLLCPNCHSQTLTYGRKNKVKNRI